ncbi:Hypothetical protein FKW44_008958 [Caligus rogercresseyi]|uniref:Uncharacterized protein n=1 Tax=Caligus rogercresseyi TaxID=217165 RepID=A0A7T8HEM5_CALRO|nr:Hypothetical protein FKW44_008958 [Caligus rogercresseyi]
MEEDSELLYKTREERLQLLTLILSSTDTDIDEERDMKGPPGAFRGALGIWRPCLGRMIMSTRVSTRKV